MNHRTDIDRVLQAWMADGPTSIPDRVVDVVAARIVVQRQRRSWPFPGRSTTVSTQLKLIVGLAAAIVVAAIGWNLLPRSPGFGAQTPVPSPSLTAAPSAAGGPIDVADEDTVLAPGAYRWHPFGDQPTLSVVAQLPDGWRSVGQLGMTIVGRQTDAPDGMGIAFLRADGLFKDPCHWDVNGTGDFDQPGDVVVGPRVIDLVEALRANTGYTVPEPPSLVSFGQFQGYEMEIQLPADLNLETCDAEAGTTDHRFLVFSGVYGSLYAQGDGNRWHLFVVDVGGTRVIVAVLYYEGTPAATQQAAQSIIESLQFTP